ncbi:hypothetical protein D3C84_950700 [compost metagenome]
MPGDDDLLHIWKLLTITQPGDDFVQRLEGTHAKRCGGFAAGHPLIAVPAQYSVSHRMLFDVGFIEKLRGDHQGRVTLTGQLSRAVTALEIGLCIAQPAMDDDQHALDFCRSRADAHRYFT